jgi:hypothetical protein
VSTLYGREGGKGAIAARRGVRRAARARVRLCARAVWLGAGPRGGASGLYRGKERCASGLYRGKERCASGLNRGKERCASGLYRGGEGSGDAPHSANSAHASSWSEAA